MMMQGEALKNQEISNEELAPAVEITDTTGTRAYHIDAEHDLDHRVTTGAVKLKNNQDGKHDDVNVLRERINLSVWGDRVDKDTVRHGGENNKEKTAVKHWYEKPEGRDGMNHSNLKRKYNEVPGYKLIGDEQDPHDDDEGHDVSKVEKLSRKSGRTFRAEPVTKSPGDIAEETILNKDPRKDKVHEEPKTNYKVKYDKNNAVKTQMYEKPDLKDEMLKNNSKPVIKSLGGAACENPLDTDCGTHRAHEKPG
jgi:hypothetical protein